jgi:L-ascorbate metabolism protein UlaG (beta-lactamase superfamily)
MLPPEIGRTPCTLLRNHVFTGSEPIDTLMSKNDAGMTYIGGPTGLIEWSGLRFLTDPTFDPAGSAYPTSEYTLRKTMGPAIDASAIGPIDAVLLSHDHHFDNLDRAGRALLASARAVLTTQVGATRVGSNASGLAAWEQREMRSPEGTMLRVTATPARHGPAGGDRGPVIGFALTREDAPGTVYVSGDTVWYDGVREVSERFDVRVALLFCGRARVRVAGENDLTMSADDAVRAAQAMARATIVPLHYEGWEHFTQSRADLERAFAKAGLSERLAWPAAGVPTSIAW